MKVRQNQSGQGILEVVVTIALVSIIVIALVALGSRSLGNSNSSKNEETARNLAAQWIEILKSLQAANTPGSVIHYCAGGVTAPASPNIASCLSGNDWARSTNCCGYTNFGKSFSDIFAYNFDEINPPTATAIVENPYGHKIHLHNNLPEYNVSPYNAGGSSLPIYDPAQGDCNVSPQGWCLDFHNSESWININNVLFRIQLYLADTPESFGGNSKCNITTTDFNKIKQFTVKVFWKNQSGDHEVISVACLTPN